MLARGVGGGLDLDRDPEVVDLHSCPRLGACYFPGMDPRGPIDPVFESVNWFSPEQFQSWVAERKQQGDVNRYELLNRRIVMTPPAGWAHSSAAHRFGSRLESFVAGKLGRVFESSAGYVLPSGHVVEPDVSFISAERWAKNPPDAPGDFLRIVPDLVAEVLSPSTASRDRGEKQAIYEKNGVREYWLIDAIARRITVFALQGGGYQIAQHVEVDGEVDSRILPGFRVSLADLLA